MSIPVEQSEDILADVPANLFQGIESVGGRLKITSRRLVFQPHLINFQRQPVEILLSDISMVKKRNTALVIPNGMLVRTKAGTEYKFVVWRRENLVRIIANNLA
jgi:hypothetical protein